jgi:hypothetical protein
MDSGTGMTLMGLLGGASTIVTLASGVKEVADNVKNHQNIKKINSLDEELQKKISSEIKYEYVAEKIDEYLAKHSSEYKTSCLTDLFSPENIDEVKAELYKNKDLLPWKTNIDKVIDEYFRKLNEYLNRVLSVDTKYLSAKMDRQFYLLMKEIKNGKLTNVYEELPYVKSIVETINKIFAIFKVNLDVEIDMYDLDESVLKSNNLNDAVSKLSYVLGVFDKKGIEKITNKVYASNLEAMHYFVLSVAQDTSLEMNEYYNSEMSVIMKYIYGYKKKDNEYYWSIGRMNLEINDEIGIFTYVMSDIFRYFTYMYDAIQNKWKDKKLEEIEDIVTKEMYKHMIVQSGISRNEKVVLLVKQVYEAKEITDVDLAVNNTMSIDALRKTLYEATKTILTYKYVDMNTTMLSLNGGYKKMLDYYFSGKGEKENEE